jgi:hypothetical protein
LVAHRVQQVGDAMVGERAVALRQLRPRVELDRDRGDTEADAADNFFIAARHKVVQVSVDDAEQHAPVRGVPGGEAQRKPPASALVARYDAGRV